MAYRTLLVDEGEVVTITLNRPERLNAMNQQMVDELREVCVKLTVDPPKVVVITGAGRGFCAGADLLSSTFSEPGDRGDIVAKSLGEHFNPMVLAFDAMPCPKIAMVNGVAAGGGASLAMLTDIVVAAKSAQFIQVFAPKLGLVPDLGGTWLLERLVGGARARGLALLGDALDAETAAAWGFIWQAVDDDQLVATVSAIAQRLASGPTRAFVETAKALDASMGNSLAEQLEVEKRAQQRLARTPEFQKLLAAFANRAKG